MTHIFTILGCRNPLCAFLNLPVPDVPFPYENSGVRKLEEILALYRQQPKPAR